MTPMFDNFDAKNFSKRLLFIVAVFLILGILIITPYFVFEKIYQGKIYPGVYLGQYYVGGMTREEMRELINSEFDKLNQNGIVFTYKDDQTVISPTIALMSGEAAYEVIIFNTDDTINQAFAVGRQGSYTKKIIDKFSALTNDRQLKISYAVNNDDIIKTLKESYSHHEIEPKNADIKANTDTDDVSFEITNEQRGVTIDYADALYKLSEQIAELEFNQVELISKVHEPTLYKKDCGNIIKETEDIIERTPITLSLTATENASSTQLLINNGNTWLIEKPDLANWLSIKNSNNKPGVTLKQERVIKYLKEKIASSTDREPIDAKFEVVDGKVTEFEPSQDGLKVELKKSYKQILSDIIDKKATSSTIIIESIKSNLSTEDVNDLGIKEIIGTGHSNFSGSPANRRHNIKVGTDKLNGLIIKPNEEFSLVKALGSVEAADGYLPELVIKGNKTIPEYGGGLCQVATTLFRSALQSGLPITARRNHAYRVSYYEPAGMDAAIYMPWPDVKFINDTGNNILIQVRYNGNDLYFDFWGIKDGREIIITDPVIYNIVGAGPTKIVETPELTPGQKKCTESAHAGADAYFDYTVKMPDSEIREERFSSHYVPWQAVCLVGVEELSEEGGEDSDEEGGEDSDEEKNEELNPTGASETKEAAKPETTTPESLGIIFEE